jgi:hypothetical protein
MISFNFFFWYLYGTVEGEPAGLGRKEKVLGDKYDQSVLYPCIKVEYHKICNKTKQNTGGQDIRKSNE